MNNFLKIINDNEEYKDPASEPKEDLIGMSHRQWLHYLDEADWFDEEFLEKIAKRRQSNG